MRGDDERWADAERARRVAQEALVAWVALERHI
jgi:hypothetical protein